MKTGKWVRILGLAGWLALTGFGAAANAAESPNAGEAETPAPLSLSACIETALKNNPALRSARSETKAAAADREIAEGERWPAIDLRGGAARRLDDQRLIPASANGEPGVFSRNIVDAGVVLRMPLYAGGRIVNTIRAAELTEADFRARFARTRRELVFNVTSAFYTILGQKRQLESIEFSRDVLQKDRERIQALIEAKKAARNDLLRMDVRLAQVEQTWVRVRNEIHAAWRTLNNLMGVETNFGDSMPELEGELTPMPALPAGEGAFQAALANRNDFQAARARADAQARRVDAARGQRLPRVNLEGAYGYRFAGDPSDRPDGADAAEDRGAVGVTLELPVFEGGRIQARVRRETEKWSALREDLTSLRLRIQREVETALYDMQSARRRVATQEAAIAQAREALRIEQEKYRLGKGAILDVLDAQRALLEIETEYYRALAEYHIAIGRFRLAEGDLS